MVEYDELGYCNLSHEVREGIPVIAPKLNGNEIIITHKNNFTIKEVENLFELYNSHTVNKVNNNQKPDSPKEWIKWHV